MYIKLLLNDLKTRGSVSKWYLSYFYKLRSEVPDFLFQCTERHEYVCPELLEKSKCSKRKFCPYPHSLPLYVKIQNKRKSAAKRIMEPVRKETVETSDNMEKQDYSKVSNCRYFTSRSLPNVKEDLQIEEPKDDIIVIEDSDDEEPQIEKPKFYPEFIPLENITESQL